MLGHGILRKKRKGHSYDLAVARRGSGGGILEHIGVGEFRRIDSVARKDGKRLLRSAASVEEERQRRGSDGDLGKSNRLGVVRDLVQLRRSSSPNIAADLDKWIKPKPRPQSTYMELLEEVTSDLNLQDARQDSLEEEERTVDTVFGFLEEEEDGLKVIFETKQAPEIILPPLKSLLTKPTTCLLTLLFPEACRSRDPEQDVHQDRIPILYGEEGFGDNLAEVLLSVYQGEQVSLLGSYRLLDLKTLCEQSLSVLVSLLIKLYFQPLLRTCKFRICCEFVIYLPQFFTPFVDRYVSVSLP